MSDHPYQGPPPAAALTADAAARQRGRVEILNMTRPGGMDGWTMDADQYALVCSTLFEALDALADSDGTAALKDVTAFVQSRLAGHPLFPQGRLTNYVRYTKVDLEPRCQLQRVANVSPQRIKTH